MVEREVVERESLRLDSSSRSVVGGAFGLGVADFVVKSEQAETVVHPRDELPKSVNLAVLLENHAVERFDVVLQMQTERFEGNQPGCEWVGVSHREILGTSGPEPTARNREARDRLWTHGRGMRSKRIASCRE